MSTNGIPSYSAIQAVFAAGEAERGPGPDQVAEEREAERAEVVQLLQDLNEKLAKLAAPPPLLRSKLSAKQKSDLIDQLGPQGYLALPWDDQPPKRDRFGRVV